MRAQERGEIIIVIFFKCCFRVLSFNITEVDSTEILSGAFPKLSMVAYVILLCPLGTPSVERSFSTMKRVLTRLRQRMTFKNMEACMLVSMEGPDKLTEDIVAPTKREKNSHQFTITLCSLTILYKLHYIGYVFILYNHYIH